jgi:hypothetical protein
MKSASIVSAALAALASVAPTQAAAQNMGSDVRCLIVSNLFAKNAKEAKARTLASSVRLFYGGRVSALSAAQIQSAVVAQQKQVTSANAGTTMNACAQSMDQALRKIQAAGQKLK